MTAGLVKYEAARKALAEAQRVDEVKSIRDKAEAMRAYAVQAKDTDLQNMAAEIRLRAERRAGELLRDMDETGQRRPEGGPGRGKKTVPQGNRFSKPTLADLGVTKKQSSAWQKVASIPAPQFEAAIAGAREHKKELTTAAVLRAATAGKVPTERELPRQVAEDDDGFSRGIQCVFEVDGRIAAVFFELAELEQRDLIERLKQLVASFESKIGVNFERNNSRNAERHNTRNTLSRVDPR